MADFMTRSQIENKILKLTTAYDVAGLKKLQEELKAEQKKLDAWFDRYLDMFDKDMDPDNGDTAVWQLYRKKFRQYGEIDDCLTTLNHFGKKVKPDAFIR